MFCHLTIFSDYEKKETKAIKNKEYNHKTLITITPLNESQTQNVFSNKTFVFL